MLSHILGSIVFTLLGIMQVAAQNSNSMLPEALEYPELLYRMPPLPLTASVSGRVYTEIGTSIPSVTINLSGSASGLAVTNYGGTYFINLDPDGDYAIVPHKSNDVMVNNGITTIDLLLMRQHILSVQPLSSPYRIIAGDVDGSGSLTTIDYLHIRSVILQITNSFPSGKLWVFVKSDFAFSDPLRPYPYQDFRTYNNIRADYQEQDFIGIKLGDVNFSWDPSTPKASPVGEVQFSLGEREIEQGKEIVVPVKVKGFKNITGYQFTLSWNPDVLALQTVTNKVLTGFYGLNNISKGYLTTTWSNDQAQPISLSNDETAFELKFMVKGKPGERSEIKICSDLTTAEAYNENLDLLTINTNIGMVKVEDPSSTFNKPHSINSLQVVPNPFTERAWISFTLEQDERVQLTIYDTYGRQAINMDNHFNAGNNEIEWSDNVAQGIGLPKGIYYVSLIAGEFSQVRKIIKVE